MLEIAFGFALVMAAFLCVKLWRRNRETERLIEALLRGEKPGARAWLFSPRLAALLEGSFEKEESERKRDSESAFNLQAILSSMSEGVLVTDADQTVRVVNDSFRKLFNLTSNPVGNSVISALRESLVEELVQQTFAEGRAQARELTIPSPGHATSQHFEVSAVPLLDGGNVTGAVFVFRDITQIRQLETMRREFVSNVSHELRTPLSIFHGYVENLLEEPAMPDDERSEIYQILGKHTRRLNALLEDLLTLARLEGRRLELQPVAIDVAEFLEDFANDWRPRLSEQGLDLRVICETEMPHLVADELRLEQVMTNLLSNAEKFTDPGGAIILRARVADAFMVLAVEDSGQGIPSKDVPHIFERFYRVEKARSREKGGTGLGLSIVKHIIALHGGTVEARSQLGKGTTILANFPLQNPNAEIDD